MVPGHASTLPALLSQRGHLQASHPVHGQTLELGHIYVAPPDAHLELRDGHLSVTRGPKENGHRPSIDRLFRTASQAYGPRVIGVILSGSLDCGTAGLISVKARGGQTIVQDPAEAAYPSMPRSAMMHAEPDHVAQLKDIPPLLEKLTRELVSMVERPVHAGTLQLEGSLPGSPAPLVCPACQGVLTEARVGGFEQFRCHVGHTFSLRSVVEEQGEHVERALWAAARALDESARMTKRLAERSEGHLKSCFWERHLEQAQQSAVIRELLGARRAPSEA